MCASYCMPSLMTGLDGSLFPCQTQSIWGFAKTSVSKVHIDITFVHLSSTNSNTVAVEDFSWLSSA